MYKDWIAYLLWFFGGMGTLGLHRFYLGKTGTGILWFFTGGLGMVGSIYDLVTMGDQVREANLRRAYGLPAADPRRQIPAMPSANKDSVERSILKLARARSGAVTVSEVALEADIEIAKARMALDRMASEGYAEMKVRANGSIVYFFKEFSPEGKDEYLEI